MGYGDFFKAVENLQNSWEDFDDSDFENDSHFEGVSTQNKGFRSGGGKSNETFNKD